MYVKLIDLYSAYDYDAGHTIDLHVGGGNLKIEGGSRGA